MFGAELLRHAGEPVAGGFGDRATAVADDVQVVGHAEGSFVMGVVVAEVDPGHEVEPEEQVERMVDRGPRYAGAFFPEPAVDLVGVEVGVGAVDLLQHVDAFRGAAEPFGLHEGPEQGLGLRCLFYVRLLQGVSGFCLDAGGALSFN